MIINFLYIRKNYYEIYVPLQASGAPQATALDWRILWEELVKKLTELRSNYLI